jgi:hypothetical protein
VGALLLCPNLGQWGVGSDWFSSSRVETLGANYLVAKYG